MEETEISIIITMATMLMDRIIKIINKMDTRIENITITMGMFMHRTTIITIVTISSCSMARIIQRQQEQRLLLLLPTVQ